MLPPNVAPIHDAEFAPSSREKGYADVDADLGLSSLWTRRGHDRSHLASGGALPTL
jgi:hypothetical protein